MHQKLLDLPRDPFLRFLAPIQWRFQNTAGSAPSNSLTILPGSNQISGAGFSYDANGNMTSDGVNSLTYDAENHNVSANSSSSYSYDGHGLRIQKSASGTSTVYIFSGSKVIAEYDNGAAPSSPSREYIFAADSLIATIDSSGTRYHLHDHLSTRALTDSSGNLIGEQGHFPFGEQWYASNTTTKWQFTTYEDDSDTGNDYAQAREYVDRLGRFSAPDPMAGRISNPQSLDRYPYVHDDPVNLTDPTGLYGIFATKPPGVHTCIWTASTGKPDSDQDSSKGPGGPSTEESSVEGNAAMRDCVGFQGNMSIGQVFALYDGYDSGGIPGTGMDAPGPGTLDGVDLTALQTTDDPTSPTFMGGELTNGENSYVCPGGGSPGGGCAQAKWKQDSHNWHLYTVTCDAANKCTDTGLNGNGLTGPQDNKGAGDAIQQQLISSDISQLTSAMKQLFAAEGLGIPPSPPQRGHGPGSPMPTPPPTQSRGLNPAGNQSLVPHPLALVPF